MKKQLSEAIWLCRFAMASHFTSLQVRHLLDNYEIGYLIEHDCNDWKKTLIGAQQWNVSSQLQRSIWLEAQHEAAQLTDMYGVAVWNSNGYPKSLSDAPSPPNFIFYKGDISLLDSEQQNTSIIVGSRRPSAYGIEVTKRITRRFVQIGSAIASGLAIGIDKTAHETTLECGGATIAVLGSGLESIYPTANINLAEDIVASGGLLLSEYLPDTKPKAWQFPARNRILASIAKRIVVTEAQAKSGSLITAGFGFDQGKPVYAVPGSILLPFSAGCNQLLQDGAIMLDLDTPLGMDGGGSSNYGLCATSEKSDEPWLEILAQSPTDPIMLSRLVGASLSEVNAWLVKMELDESIKFDRGRYHVTSNGWNKI